MAESDPELAAVLAGVAVRPARRVAAAVVNAAATPRSRAAFIDADPRTRFEIGSITKGLTGMLLADAIERGEIALQDTVGDVLPDTAGSPLGAVTVQQLCTHTSGLPRGPLTPAFLVRATVLLGLLGLDPYRGTTPSSVIRTALARPLREPATFAYSNLGGAVLGQALAAAASMDYATLLQSRIFEPLVMSASQVATKQVAAPPGRSAGGLPRMPWILDGFAPAGGVVSTLEDMTRLAVALLRGEAAPGVNTPGLAALDPIRGVATDLPGRRIGMFWMTDVEPATGRARIWHNGATGGYSAFLALYPEVRQGVVVLTGNARGADTGRMAASLAQTFIR